jgi:hypothetical protein
MENVSASYLSSGVSSKNVIYTRSTWFSRPNPKILGHLAQCRIVSDPQSVWEKLAEGNPVSSSHVTLLNDCGPHRYLKTFIIKQRLFLLKS